MTYCYDGIKFLKNIGFDKYNKRAKKKKKSKEGTLNKEVLWKTPAL
jgi:hypothetical protein